MGGVASAFHTTALLPSLRSTRARPSAEPIASPSGLTWLLSRKRLPWRIRARSVSGGVFVVMVQFLQDLRHADAVLGAAVEDEHQLGDGAQVQPAGELAAQEARCVAQRF